MGVKLQWSGVEELKKTLTEVGVELDDTNDKLKDVLLVPCQKAMDTARNLAPSRTGLLRSAIYATKGGKKQRGIYMGVKKKVKGKSTFYGRFVEFGTSKMQAQPFFRPALLGMHPTFVSDIAPGVKKIVEETAAANAYHPPG